MRELFIKDSQYYFELQNTRICINVESAPTFGVVIEQLPQQHPSAVAGFNHLLGPGVLEVGGLLEVAVHLSIVAP